MSPGCSAEFPDGTPHQHIPQEASQIQYFQPEHIVFFLICSFSKSLVIREIMTYPVTYVRKRRCSGLSLSYPQFIRVSSVFSKSSLHLYLLYLFSKHLISACHMLVILLVVYFFEQQRQDMQVQNKHMETKGRGGGVDGETGVDSCSTLHGSDN